jgi:hypothetical protein
MGFKKIVRNFFPALVEMRNHAVNEWAHYRFRSRPIKEVFTTIYNENHWSDQQSRSGTGSNNQQTVEVKIILSTVIQELNCKTILDLPCGDFNWVKDVDFGTCRYFGADIVEELIASNKKKYENSRRSFSVLDLTNSVIPKVELIFNRDCLVHLSYEDIHKALDNIKKSGSTWLLTTTFPHHKNRNIITGNWRPINLNEPPFSFPQPRQIYDEKCSESDNRYRDKSLALWKIASLEL